MQAQLDQLRAELARLAVAHPNPQPNPKVTHPKVTLTLTLSLSLCNPNPNPHKARLAAAHEALRAQLAERHVEAAT